VDAARASPKVAAAAEARWANVVHPNLVALQRCFCLHKALFFAHDYWPTAQTLTERFKNKRARASHRIACFNRAVKLHFARSVKIRKQTQKNRQNVQAGFPLFFHFHFSCRLGMPTRHRYAHPRQSQQPQQPPPVPEALLWSFVAQLASALRVVHGCGLACRCVSPAHVLVTSGSRVRIGGLGVLDVLEYDQVCRGLLEGASVKVFSGALELFLKKEEVFVPVRGGF
jgi:hypothetical protein